MTSFLERHAKHIRGITSCLDRVVITGTLPEICHAGAMTALLNAQQIRIFDYASWARPLREELREHAEYVAGQEGLEIEFI